MNNPFENSDPHYRAMVDPLTADKRNRVIPAYGLRRKRIALDVALVEQEFKLSGDFVYCDFNSTGVAECSLNSVSEDAFPLLSLAGVQGIPYDGLYITAAAQPGLFINLWYGYAAQFISPTSAIATIGSITNPVKIEAADGTDIKALTAFEAIVAADNYLLTEDGGFNFGVSYQAQTNLVGGTPNLFLAAASNVAGVIVHDSSLSTASATVGSAQGLVCKATAPTLIVDGQLLQHVMCAAANVPINSGHMAQAKRIASGLRLDHFSTANEVNAVRFCQYTIL